MDKRLSQKRGAGSVVIAILIAVGALLALGFAVGLLVDVQN
jgi:hypothetical protein